MNKPADIKAPEKERQYLRQFELVDRVRAYDPSVNEDLLNKAYVFSMKAHGDQKRHSGDPYYAHPIEVAGILTSLHLDVASICTALLHDVLEDTDTDYEELSDLFGEEIADLVQGVTKLTKLELSIPDASREVQQAENFQKFVLAMSKDVRVLLVKLCDRLHNMRTLEHHPKAASRERIARETLEIYAPLARRIGVDSLCAELEDIAFFHLDPNGYETITNRLTNWRSDQEAVISQMSIALRNLMDAKGMDVRIYGREKRAYAVWRKLERQGISFDDVSDIYAFRMVVETREDCYITLGLLHDAYRCVPDRFRDFISVPKPNGYQSLHTTILGENNRRVEIQIRTERMEDVAERGVAAHWTYKDESYAYDPEKARLAGGNPLQHVRSLVEMLEHGGDANEFLEHAKLEMFSDQVFTFTPGGDLISLPRGATPIDFAYAVHTKIGDTCVGARINGRERPLRNQLKNGDTVDIIRGGQAEPQAGWEHMVITGRARSALRRLTRDRAGEEFRLIGHKLALRSFKRAGQDLEATRLTDALKRLNMTHEDEIYEAIGRGALSSEAFLNAVFPGMEKNDKRYKIDGRELIEDSSVHFYVRGDGLTAGIGLHLSPCCQPINGDRIIGVLSKNKGVAVHTIDCQTLEVPEINKKDWIDLTWRKSATQTTSIARIIMTMEHIPGALADVTRIIGSAHGNVINVRTLHRNSSFFDLLVDIEVVDNRHLSQIIAALRASIYIVNIDRTRNDQYVDS